MWSSLLSSGLSRPQYQLWSPIPRTVPSTRPSRCISITRPICLPVEDRGFTLGDTFKDQSNRESVLCSCRGLVQPGITSKFWLRALYGGGPLGRHHSPGLWQRRHRAMRTWPRLSRQSALEYGLLVTHAYRQFTQPSRRCTRTKSLDWFWWGLRKELKRINARVMSLKFSQVESI